MLSCTVIPTYSNHFDFALNAVKTHNQFVDTDLFFVFTTLKEYDEFTKLAANYKWKYLILPEDFNPSFNHITYKKFYAIDYLSKQYQYIGVFDSEILFVRPMDTDVIYKEISDSKIFKSNRRHNPEHLENLIKLMQLSDNKRLIEETDNFTQYWWFNEICVYETELFNKFYNWLLTHPNFDNIVNDFISFDYLLYSIWLLSFEGYKLRKYFHHLTCAGAMIETNYNNNNTSMIFQSYQDRNINYRDIEHIKVQIMIDRDETHCKIEGEIKPFGIKTIM